MKIFLPLLLLVLALPACRTNKKSKDMFGRQRDYYSVNRSSRAFLRGTSRKFKEIRRDSWRGWFDNPERKLNNRDVRKESMRYGKQSFWFNQRVAYEAMKRSIREEPARNREFRKGAMRFGFVDSGD